MTRANQSWPRSTAQAGNPALVYHSIAVTAKPVVQATFQTDNAVALPASVIATLTWNGTQQSDVTRS